MNIFCIQHILSLSPSLFPTTLKMYVSFQSYRVQESSNDYTERERYPRQTVTDVSQRWRPIIQHGGTPFDTDCHPSNDYPHILRIKYSLTCNDFSKIIRHIVWNIISVRSFELLWRIPRPISIFCQQQTFRSTITLKLG